MSLLVLAALLSYLSLSKQSPIHFSQEENGTKLSYSIDSDFAFFPGKTSLPKLTSFFDHSDLFHSSKASAKIPNFLSTPCSLDITGQATNEINKTLLMRLLNATLSDTDLVCAWPSHRILGMNFGEHTMLTTHLRMQLNRHSETKNPLDVGFLEYKISCPANALRGSTNAQGGDAVAIAKDCGWCDRIAGELSGLRQLPELGKLVNETGWMFGDARCDGCSKTL
jgi:hypothetical protein